MSEELTNHGAASVRDEKIHGFYSSALNGQLLLDYEQALEVDGLENEIALLRAVIKSLILNNPFSINNIIRAINCLKGLIRTQKTVFKPDYTTQLRQAFNTVFKDLPACGLAPA